MVVFKLVFLLKFNIFNKNALASDFCSVEKYCVLKYIIFKGKRAGLVVLFFSVSICLPCKTAVSYPERCETEMFMCVIGAPHLRA